MTMQRRSKATATKTVADELRPNYELGTLLEGDAQGKYAKRYRELKRLPKPPKHTTTAKTR